MIAVGYIRRSKKSEAGVVSLDAQSEAINQYCDRQGYLLAAMVSHDGISGTKRGRFDAIEKSIVGTGAKVLVVYNLDRLARDNAGLLDYLRSLTARGIVLHESTSGRIDFKKSLGRLVVSVRGAMDEFYASVIGEKTSDALRYMKEQGLQYTRVPPLGWRYIEGRMIEDEEEQRALTIIAECRTAGFGRVRTLQRLRRAGYNGRGSLSTIQRLLEGGAPA